MTAIGAILLLVSVLTDVAGQTFFKLALERGTRSPFVEPLLWLGVATYALQFGCWLLVLTSLPLSYAFPVGALAYPGVVLAGRMVLGEHVSLRRWLGAAAVSIGVGIVAVTL